MKPYTCDSATISRACRQAQLVGWRYTSHVARGALRLIVGSEGSSSCCSHQCGRVCCLGLVIVGAIFPTRATAISIPIFPSRRRSGHRCVARQKVSLLSAGYGPSDRDADHVRRARGARVCVGQHTIDAIITSATLTLFFPVAPAVVNTAEVHAIRRAASSRRRT